jgi:hypothetical protein
MENERRKPMVYITYMMGTDLKPCNINISFSLENCKDMLENCVQQFCVSEIGMKNFVYDQLKDKNAKEEARNGKKSIWLDEDVGSNQIKVMKNANGRLWDGYPIEIARFGWCPVYEKDNKSTLTLKDGFTRSVISDFSYNYGKICDDIDLDQPNTDKDNVKDDKLYKPIPYSKIVY